ncbi:MAG: zinc ABC transporter substrate-binding protein [bacterium]
MKKSFFILSPILFFVFGCGDGWKDAKNQITVSILPQKYFVEKIAGNRFDVNVMIPPGHSPHVYEPTPQQMRSLSRSILYFRIGYIPFEKSWMDKIRAANEDMKIVDTSAGVDLIAGGHVHEEEGEYEEESHDGEGIDPHIWLSPRAVRVQVMHISEAVIALDPENQMQYRENTERFLEEIDALDLRIALLYENIHKKKFLVYHSAWSYFARDYGLVQVPIEIGGKNPNPSDLKHVIDTAKEENIRTVFVQKQSDTRSAEAVASEIGARVVRIDPLAYDWLENLEQAAHTFQEALK